MSSDQHIIFEELSGRDGNLGVVTLNRQNALNAITHKMINDLNKQLTVWESAEQIKAVIIRAAEGRAFCAGGDIRNAYEKANDPNLSQFFKDEYLLNTRIHHYSKPYIAFLDGITMGGGVGISIHGSHRIATEKLVFAMPETAIGFFPDVGATYFLPRLPFKMGFYLGLTSARITYNDCVGIGIANHCVSSSSFAELTHSLADTSLNENPKAKISEVIDQYAITYPPSDLLTYKNEIESCFSKTSMEEIMQALQHIGSEWCLKTFETLKTKSPTSLKVTLNALLRGHELSFDECMRMEYRLTCRFLQGKEFFEGIRAAVIDKDQKPKWNPSHLKDVLDDDVQEYFSPLEQELK
jgi:enoyl-CoA hydratase